MSEMSVAARAANKAKAHRMAAGEPGAKVDASTWEPPEGLLANAKAGLRPISKRAYKRGGKVEGEKTHERADRKPRKAGGSATAEANAKVNRNVKDANAEFGKPHIGGYNHGGKAKKAGGGSLQDIQQGAAAGMQAAANRSGVGASRMGFTRKQGVPLPGSGMKKGGVAEHEDAAQDMALIKKTVKADAMKKNGGGAGKWIQGAIGHPGALHKELHITKGHKIPEKKLEKAEHSKNPKLAKRAHLAETLRSMHAHGGEVKPNAEGGTRPTGGRLARKEGGRTGKGKTTVNIVIASGKPQGDDSSMPLNTAPVKPPAMPVVVPPPAQMGPGAGGAPPMPVPMPNAPPPAMMGRKTGGRVYKSYKDMDAGALGGKGRLEKTEIASRQR